MMKDEEARRIAAIKAFRVADRKAQKLTTKLTKVEREKKSAKKLWTGQRSRRRLSANNSVK